MNNKIKMVIINIFFFVLFSYSYLYSQNDTISKSNIKNINTDSIAQNALYIDIMGHNYGYGFYYDRAIFFFPTIFNNYTSIIPRIGISFHVRPGHIALPIMLSVNFGKVHRIEFGFGFFYDFVGKDKDEDLNYPSDLIKWILNIGFRYQKLDGGFVCRVGFSPFFYSNGYNYFLSTSFGYAW